MKTEDPGRKATFPIDEAFPTEVPPGVDRRTFMMRSAVIGSAAVITGCTPTEKQQTAAASAPPPAVPKNVSLDLDVKRQTKGPVMTTIDEFYKVGPGPSSSHTIGPMRITYDFYQRCTKLPKEKLDQATALKVHLFGSLSATGLGHGTERASLAGHRGQGAGDRRPALPRRPAGQARPGLPGEARRQDVRRLPEGRRLRLAQGRLPAPEHHDLQAHGGGHRAPRAGVLLRRRRVHRVEGLRAAEEGPAEVPVLDDEGAAGPRRGEQAVRGADRDGERGRGLRQDARPRSTPSSTRSRARWSRS